MVQVHGSLPAGSPETWSQIVEQTPGHGVTASSGGMTAPSTTAAGMPGYVVPLLGLTPPDFSNWSLPPPEVPLSRGLAAASQGLPGIGRSNMIRGSVERHASAQQVLVAWAMLAPCTPRWHCLSVSHNLARLQPHISRQYSHRDSPLGGESHQLPFDKAAPMGSQTTEDNGRQKTRGWGNGGQSASCPRGAQESRPNIL